ncbi:glutathione S-transferase family protein [Ramlibacter rhizophilus]|uniref:Glutathione S-transferase n=1 Tax=Ramlibacter rhizophilus TaxID=1781167 RepID=A0A4Z0BJM4_9BURK|nr:glutathione S-transferase family protein [Ramlibacter rhizophilus]TFY98629.1 glutathione S-transferase [Ramlibacter rhizophilus]
MRLRLTSASPFARKVRVTAHELGIADRIELVPTVLRPADADFLAQNPLGRVPVLETADGEVYVDSHVICEWLDATFGGHRLLPQTGPDRWRALSLAAIAGGVVEAAMHVRRERARPEGQADAALVTHALGQVNRALDRLQHDIAAPALAGARGFDHAAIALACTVGWLIFRFDDKLAFEARPTLHRWWTGHVLPRPSMQATLPA